MTVVTYQPSTVSVQGPRNSTLTYFWQVPSGSSVTDHAFFGPVDLAPNQTAALHVSGTPSGAGGGPLITVFGTLDSSTIGPTSRNWFLVRGDASAANVLLSAVSAGLIKIISPVRALRVRVSSSVNAGVSSPINVRCMVYSVGHMNSV